MIPLRLQLKNFLSYGPNLQTIDFEPYQLICLSGKNGHGKSALLDAITWALWGQARKISGASKADPHLVHLGQYNMLVIFDFILNGVTYRVRREFTHAYGKSTAGLDIGVIDPTTGNFNSLTTTAIRTTQEVIIDTLGLTYESFINTAFLRQGSSNEFSKKSPKERKEILSTILGLQHYDTVRTKALEKVRKIQEAKAVTTLFLQKLQQKSQENNQIIISKSELENHLQKCLKEESFIKGIFNHLELQENSLIRQYEQRVEKKRNFDQQRAHFNSTKQNFLASFYALRKQKRTVSLATLDSLEKEYEKSNEKSHLLQIACQEVIKLKERINFLHTDFQKIENSILRFYEERLQETEKKIRETQIALEVAQTNAHHIQNQMVQENSSYTALQEQLKSLIETTSLLENQIPLISLQKWEKKKHYYHQWVAQAKNLHSQKGLLEEKRNASLENNDSYCSLCHQSLPDEKKRALQLYYQQKENHLHHKLNRFHTLLPDLKQILIKEHATLEAVKKQQEQ